MAWVLKTERGNYAAKDRFGHWYETDDINAAFEFRRKIHAERALKRIKNSWTFSNMGLHLYSYDVEWVMKQ